MARSDFKIKKGIGIIQDKDRTIYIQNADSLHLTKQLTYNDRKQENVQTYTLGKTSQFENEVSEFFEVTNPITTIDDQNRSITETNQLQQDQLEITDELINVEQDRIVYLEPSMDKHISFPPIDIESPLESLDRVPLTSVCPWLNVEDPTSCLNEVNLENIELYLECSDDVENSELYNAPLSEKASNLDNESTSIIKSDVQLRISFPDFKDERDKGFKCCVCKKTFTLEYLLRDHLRIEHSNQAYVCQLCIYNTKSRKFFQTHLKTKHKSATSPNERIIAPDISASLVKPQEEMVTLYFLAANEESLQANSIDESTSSKHNHCTPVLNNDIGELSGHTLISYNREVADVNEEIGDAVPASSQRASKSNRTHRISLNCLNDEGSPCDEMLHESNNELDDAKLKCVTFTCDECGFVTKTYKLLKSHQNTMHNSEREIFTCTECDFHCLQKRTFERHEQLHTGMSQFKCSFCKKQFLSKSSHTRHMKTHSTIQKCTCDINDCGKMFKSKGGLTDHKKKIHGMTNIKVPGSQTVVASLVNCKYDSRTDNSKKKSSEMEESTRDVRNGVRLDDCDVLPDNKDRIGEPLETDAMEKNECDTSSRCKTKGTQTVVMQKGNNTSTESTKNMQSGNKIKKFVCPYDGCLKRFRDNFNLKNHMCMHNGMKQLACDLCKFTCVQKASLNLHYKSKHRLTWTAQQVG